MKCLTVCQPYAHLICLPESDQQMKRVENRNWQTAYRGPLAIHAGKTRSWLETDDNRPGYEQMWGLRISDMAFSAVVCVCDLVHCCHIEAVRAGVYDKQFPWLRTHYHAFGNFCWILANVRPLQVPVPAKGKLGLWEWECLPSPVVEEPRPNPMEVDAESQLSLF